MAKQAVRRTSGVTARSFVLGIVLIPVNVYWIIYAEMVWWGLFPTTMSLFFNVVFTLFILTLLNLAVGRFRPKWALTPAELAVVYVMLCMASAVASHDRAQVLISSLGHAFWFATPENDWSGLFARYLPSWLTVQDRSILQGYYEGDSTFYQRRIVLAWLGPALWWTLFIGVLMFVMICLNVLLRRQWTDHEKLAYPIIELPTAMIQESGKSFFSNRTFWTAFVLVTLLDIVNGMRAIYPTIPVIGVRLRDISYLFTSKPWNGVGWTPFSIYPFVVGLGFVMPLDLSFSSWFFFLFRKAQHIVGAALGIRALPGFPYDRQQSLGAYLGLSLFAVWASRGYFAAVLRHVFRSSSRMDDSREPMRYRAAVVGIAVGSVFLLAFVHRIGMSLWVAVLFFGVFYVLSMGITRMRAESGAPAHDLHFMGPDYTLTALFGSRFLGKDNVTAFSLFFFMGRAHRSHVMPHQLEGFKLAERVQMRSAPLVVAMVAAILVGGLASFWAYLHDVYIYGSGGGFGWEPFNRLQERLVTPTGPNVPEISFTLAGMGFAFLLMYLRRALVWWPFHAVGYAVSGADDWCMNFIWPSLIISTVLKWIILKYSGFRLYRKLIPFFLGLVLGEFVTGSLWSIYGISQGVRIFPFKDW
ncbi:hypothetical protein FJZ36_04205 [Candidatus Poribacteria bacterium]|nr:hypothetical protein [Candidatus Poribacteria bacterium]